MKNTKRLSTFLLRIKKCALKEYPKYLGVCTDCHLFWEKHTEIANSNISKGIGILTKMSKFLQEKQLNNSHNVFTKP